jgi:hypothetical protein
MKGEVPSDDDLHLVLSLTLACKQKKHEKLRVKLIAEQRLNGFDVILGDCFDSKRAIQSLKVVYLFNAADSVIFVNPSYGFSMKMGLNQIRLRAGAWQTSLGGV